MKRIGTSRRKSRYKFGKNIRNRGKVSLSRYFQQFKEGDSVALVAEPAVQRGLYHPRFHGRVAKVTGTRGKCYEVTFKEDSKTKTVIVHPVHLKKMEGGKK